jgi:hypothetical protein
MGARAAKRRSVVEWVRVGGGGARRVVMGCLFIDNLNVEITPCLVYAGQISER